LTTERLRPVATPKIASPQPTLPNEEGKTNTMRTVLAAAALSIFWTTCAQCEEAPAVTVAIIRMDRVMNTGNFYDRARLLFGNKDIIEAIRKNNDEIKSTYDEVIKTEDSVRLAELESRMQFLKRKVGILRQGIADGGRDIQGPFREFVVKTYGAKYPIILQDLNAFDRCLNRRVEIVDLSDEAADKFRAYIDQLVGEESIPPGYMRSSGSSPFVPGVMIDKSAAEKVAAAQKAADEKLAAAKKAAEEKAAAEKAAAEKAAADKAAAEKAEAEKNAAIKAAEAEAAAQKAAK
jgi:hypothetical protein